MRKCGECTLCCELLPIPEIKKPHSELCGNCTLNKGCSIYEDRPSSCEEFNCLYIEGDIDVRPDEINVIFEKIYDDVYLGLVHYKNPIAWKSQKVLDICNDLKDKGISVIVSSYTDVPKMILTPEGISKEEIINRVNNKLNGSS